MLGQNGRHCGASPMGTMVDDHWKTGDGWPSVVNNHQRIGRGAVWKVGVGEEVSELLQ